MNQLKWLCLCIELLIFYNVIVYFSSLGGPQQDVEGAGHTRDRDTLPQEEILLQRCKRRRKVNYIIDKEYEPQYWTKFLK